MVIVADPGLIARRVTGGFDAPHHADAGKGVQGVVDGLGGQGSQPGARAGRDRLGVEVAAVVKCGEDGQPGPGDAQAARAQTLPSGIEVHPGVGHRPYPDQLSWNESRQLCQTNNTGPVHRSPGP